MPWDYQAMRHAKGLITAAAKGVLLRGGEIKSYAWFEKTPSSPEDHLVEDLDVYAATHRKETSLAIRPIEGNWYLMLFLQP